MRSLPLSCLLVCLSFPLLADDTAKWPPATGQVITIGRTDAGAPLQAWVDPDAFNFSDGRTRIAAVIDVGTHQDEYNALLTHAAQSAITRKQDNICYAVLFVPPTALPAAGERDRLLSFPPKGSAYNTADERTAATIWRFLAWFGPDVVLDVHSDHVTEQQATQNGADEKDGQWSKDCLAAAVRANSIVGCGHATPHRISCSLALGKQRGSETPRTDGGLFQTSGQKLPSESSELHEEVKRRLQRTPAEVVDQLLVVYGHDLKTVMYQPALAVLARLETARMRSDNAQLEQVAEILQPYLDGSKVALPDNANGSHFAGHLIIAEWARERDDTKAIELVRKVAERGFDKSGNPLTAMPSHSEMSDAVFMSCPILVAAAELTGDVRYLDMARRHLRFMKKLCVRDDGLYRHSPLCEAAWGRGNGFPALGLALALTDLDRMLTQPDLHADLRQNATELREEMRQSLEAHLSALLLHQDETGMWQQVIDDPVSYREMTSTCMIGFALTRGVQRGWLSDPKFAAAATRAWEAVKIRTGPKGELLDVCTGTGKQKTVEDYYNRTAILGRDERGGAMALMFAVERAKLNAALPTNPDKAR